MGHFDIHLERQCLNAVHIVEFLADAFHQTADVPVLTIPSSTDTLTQNLNMEQVGPFNAGQVDTEMIQTHHLMYVPTKYAPLFLDSHGVSPQAAWDVLIPLLIQDNKLIDFQILVNWLCVSLTLLVPVANAIHQEPMPANLKLALIGIACDDNMTKHQEIILA